MDGIPEFYANGVLVHNCSECAGMEGKTFSVADAHGLIPAHPNCRCSFIPANVGERDGESFARNRYQTRNVFCPTGIGGGIDPTCSPGPRIFLAPHAGGGGGGIPSSTAPGGVGTPAAVIHAQSGLKVGHQFTKTYKGTTYTVDVTPNGFQVSAGGIPQSIYPSMTAAAQGVMGNKTPVNGWRFFGVAKPAGATPPATPTTPTAPATPAATPTVTPTPAPAAGPIPVHSSGLPIGATYTKVHGGGTHTLTVTQGGFQLNHANGTSQTYKSLSAAAAGLKGNNTAVNGWKFFGVDKPASAAPVAAPSPLPAPTSTPGAPVNTIPFSKETAWTTGDRGGAHGPGSVLNGVPFASAPPKFWEKTKDADIKEPKPARPVTRALCIVQEDDGRVWTVEPTGHFGNRRETIPGGTVEPGLSLQQNALKETFEETGLQVEIVKHLGDVEDSNNGRNGRVYLARRIGGAPWDAKIEKSIINPKTGQPAAESETVRLSTPEHAASLLHRTDDQAMLALAAPIDVKTKSDGNMMKKVVDGIKPAAKAYEDAERRAGRQNGSSTLHAVQELRGFNEKPTVVSKQDFDKLIAKGDHIEMLRGVRGVGGKTASDLAEQFKSGDHFPGYGCFGNGTYADSSKGSGNVAGSQYGRGGDVIRMALPKDARIIKQSELEKLVPRAPSNFSSNGGGHSTDDQWQGIHAALAGYDAIHVDGRSTKHGSYGKGFYVVLNRGKIVVQKQSAKGHVIR